MIVVEAFGSPWELTQRFSEPLGRWTEFTERRPREPFRRARIATERLSKAQAPEPKTMKTLGYEVAKKIACRKTMLVTISC